MKQKSKNKPKGTKPMTKNKAKKSIALVSKPAAPAAAAPKAAPPIPPAVKLPPSPPANKRITPGARVTEWRVARSLRASKPGYFLQGGHFQKTSRGNSFIVGEEFHFKELKEANDALAKKVPPKPKPESKSKPAAPPPKPPAAAENPASPQEKVN